MQEDTQSAPGTGRNVKRPSGAAAIVRALPPRLACRAGCGCNVTHGATRLGTLAAQGFPALRCRLPSGGAPATEGGCPYPHGTVGQGGRLPTAAQDWFYRRRAVCAGWGRPQGHETTVSARDCPGVGGLRRPGTVQTITGIPCRRGAARLRTACLPRTEGGPAIITSRNIDLYAIIKMEISEGEGWAREPSRTRGDKNVL